MKWLIGFLFIVLFLFPQISVRSQDSVATVKPVKKGWNVGVLPAVSFNSDLGFQYGGLVNLFHYGDGSRYPKYDRSYYFEASRYTKGSGLLRLAYDSEQLIKNIRTTFDFSYMPEQMADFYGFNGYESVYNSDYVENDQTYPSRIFYKHQRNMFRFHADFTGSLGYDNVFWTAGAEFYDIRLRSVNVDKLNRGKKEEDKLPDPKNNPGLYEHYINWGLIPADEASGGYFTGIKGGLVYDSRDFQPNPMSGIWSDIIIYGAPRLTSQLDNGFLRLSVTHRQYFTLVKEKLSFVYRLSYQGNLGTYVPFYIQPLMITTQLRGAYSEGLGGQRSLRGILRNRVVGNGFIYGNAEFRYKFFRIEWLNQNIYLAINTFIDAGQVVSKIPVEEKVKNHFPNWTENDTKEYFNFGSESIHWSAGAGLKAVMNENFILSGDFGRALNSQDGRSGLYIGLNYLF